jgi:hypothetical protein
MHPIACDMSRAEDTPAERLAAYRALFDRALLSRERRPGAVVFRFRGERAAVEDLARREAACCPFLEQRVELAGEEVVWTLRHPSAEDILDAVHALPEPGLVRGLDSR